MSAVKRPDDSEDPEGGRTGAVGPRRPGAATDSLRGRYDDPDDPAELTVFDPDSETVTTWLTVGLDDAVGLAEMR